MDENFSGICKSLIGGTSWDPSYPIPTPGMRPFCARIARTSGPWIQPITYPLVFLFFCWWSHGWQTGKKCWRISYVWCRSGPKMCPIGVQCPASGGFFLACYSNGMCQWVGYYAKAYNHCLDFHYEVCFGIWNCIMLFWRPWLSSVFRFG